MRTKHPYMLPLVHSLSSPLFLSMGFTPSQPTRIHAVSSELRALWSMAAPITAANLLVFLRAMISVLTLGRLGRLELAGGAMAIGFTNITGYSVLFGLASALEPLCSQAFGSQNLSLVSLSFQRAVLLLLLSSLPISLLWFNLSPILLALHQDPDITAVAATFCLFSLPDLVTNSFLQPLRVYLRSQGITKPLMWSSLMAVALHGPLNLLFVFFLEFGVAGVAMAQVMTNANMVFFLSGYLYFSRVCEKSWTGWSREAAREMMPLVRLAVPSCLGVCLEWWWYEIVTIMAGYLPEPKLAVGAAAILIQTTSFMYTFPMSLGACVSTRVGNELGAGRPDKAKMAAAVALICAAAIGLLNVVWTAALPTKWAALFTSDATVISLAASALPILGLCELGNCPQTTGCGVLRGTARPATAAKVNLFSFYLVGTPVAVALTFGLRGGFSGLWFGLLSAQAVCAASVLTAVMLKTDWELEAARAKKLTAAADEREMLVNGEV